MKINRLNTASSYYAMAERIRNKAAQLEDAARREMKDAYERKLQERADRRQGAS